MDLQGTAPFSFVNDAFALPSVVGYVKGGAAVGEAIWWEWRFFHYHSHSKDKDTMKVWMQKFGAKLLQQMLDTFELPASHVCRPKSGQPPGLCSRLTLSSSVVGAMLLHAVYIRSNALDRRLSCVALCKEWLRVASAGMTNLSDDIVVVVDLPDRSHRLKVAAADLAVHGLAELLDASPWLEKWWQGRRSWVGGLQSEARLPLFGDALLLLAGMPASLRHKVPWLPQLLSALLRVTSFGVERYIDSVYFPAHGRRREFPPLRGPHRLRPIDPITRENIGRKLENIGASGSIVAEAIHGQGWHASAWRHASILLHAQACQEVFAGARRVSVACDGGSYSGEQTNIAVIFRHDTGKSAVLPAKVAYDLNICCTKTNSQKANT